MAYMKKDFKAAYEDTNKLKKLEELIKGGFKLNAYYLSLILKLEGGKYIDFGSNYRKIYNPHLYKKLIEEDTEWFNWIEFIKDKDHPFRFLNNFIKRGIIPVDYKEKL